VRVGGLCLAATAALAAAIVAGCGGVGSSRAAEPGGKELAIYSSLPLQGPNAALALQVVNGEKLALSQAGGHVGRFVIGYVSLDDANPLSGRLDPGAAESDAESAARDTTTIAYLGDWDSAATAVSLPLINAAGIPQVSPASPYSGLTSGVDAGQDEPARFYPSGVRTFAHLQPGDQAQARAQLALMRSLKVRRLFVLEGESPFQRALVQMVLAEAKRAGIAVVGQDEVADGAGQLFTSEVEKVVASNADAVFYAGTSTATAVTLWHELRAADRTLELLGSSALATETFAAQIADASAGTYLTTPLLAADRYPAPAARVLADYRAKFGGAPGAAALYGYEAMSLVLRAIRQAGSHGNDRRAVTARLLATRDRDSVIGRYSIEASGDSTLSDYGVDRVVHGSLVFDRVIHARG
jgi:branched-chain amino acid transport system substrate-binding protein